MCAPVDNKLAFMNWNCGLEFVEVAQNVEWMELGGSQRPII